MRALVLTGVAGLALAAAGQAAAATSTRPLNTARPRISGRAIEGRVLTATHGKWTHSPSSFTYRWQRCTASGHCSTTDVSTKRYRLRRADLNHRIRVIVTASSELPSKPAASKPTALVSKPSIPAATAYQLNPQHTGFSPNGFSRRARRRWSVNLGASLSYPLIVDGRVFVIAADDSSFDPSLYALNASTGKSEWGPVQLGGTYPWAGLTYDSGRVVTVNSSGTMEAFAARSGTLKWAGQLPEQWLFTSPPTASRGIVYISGAGNAGTVYAVTASAGKLVWTQSVANGDHSSPAVSSSGVYVSYACGQTYDFAPISGSLLWHRDTACEGGGGKTPVLAGGRLYVRDSSFPGVLKADTGSLLSSFRSSGAAPAVSPSMIFNVEDGFLTGAAAKPGSSVRWSFRGDGTLSSAPVVAGRAVIVAGTSGRVYSVSSTTGKVLWRGSAGAPVNAPDEQNVSQPLTGLAVSGGLLVVPAGNRLTAFR